MSTLNRRVRRWRNWRRLGHVPVTKATSGVKATFLSIRSRKISRYSMTSSDIYLDSLRHTIHYLAFWFQVVIEGVRGTGYVGDSAIDDVQIMKGEECLAALGRMMADTIVPGMFHFLFFFCIYSCSLLQLLGQQVMGSIQAIKLHTKFSRRDFLCYRWEQGNKFVIEDRTSLWSTKENKKVVLVDWAVATSFLLFSFEAVSLVDIFPPHVVTR